MANQKKKDESAGWRDARFRNNAEWEEEADGKKAGGSRGWKRASLLFVTGNDLDALPESTSACMRVLVSQNVEINAALFCMLDETLKRRLKKY